MLYEVITESFAIDIAIAGLKVKVALVDVNNFLSHRITSYNVCYTKLLRMAATLWLTGRLARRICPISSLAGPLAMAVLLFSQTFFKKGFEIRPDVPLLTVCRITSYNVCYTKLLRNHLFI